MYADPESRRRPWRALQNGAQVDVLVVVLLLLFSPVLVELVDFHSGVALLYQVKGLRDAKKKAAAFQPRMAQKLMLKKFPWARVATSHLVNFTEAPSSQKVQEQVSLVQRRVIFESAEGQKLSSQGAAAAGVTSQGQWRQRKCLKLTASCLHYLFSSAPECEGCALSPGAPAPPGSQLLPINDSGAQTQEELQSLDYKERSSSKSTLPPPHTADCFPMKY